MPAVSFTGLASNLDTDAIIQSLLAVDGISRTRLSTSQQSATARQQGINDVESRMKTLRTAAQDLGSALLWTESQSVASTDDKSVAATLTGGAAPGGYSVTVTQMASAAQSTFAYSQQLGASTIEINGVTVNLPENADIETAVKTINGTSDVGVYAVNLGNGKMVLSSRTTGSATTINAAGDSLALDSTKAGRDLKWSLDNVAQPDSASNTVANAIPGVQLAFKAPTTGTTVNVSDPQVAPDAIKAKLKAFVSAYNDVVSFTSGKLTEPKIVKNTSSTSATDDTTLTAAEASQGVLFGDPGLRDMLSNLRQTVTKSVDGLSGSLVNFAALGISTGAASATTSADAKTGLLTFDEKTFDAAYDADPDGIKKLLGGVSGTTGLSQTWDSLIKPLTEANGLLDQRSTMAGDEVTRTKDQITRLDERLADKQEAYKKMFTNMELALSKLHSSTSSVLSSLSASTSSS
jgi:flagellar hook-associated protein 2